MHSEDNRNQLSVSWRGFSGLVLSGGDRIATHVGQSISYLIKGGGTAFDETAESDRLLQVGCDATSDHRIQPRKIAFTHGAVADGNDAFSARA